MTEHKLDKLIASAVEALLRIAAALEKLVEEPEDDADSRVRGFKVGGTD